MCRTHLWALHGDATGDGQPDTVRVIGSSNAAGVCRLSLQVAHHRLCASAKRRVPTRRAASQRVSFRRLDADDPCAEPRELPARECAGQVAGEVDDENARERLHGGGA